MIEVAVTGYKRNEIKIGMNIKTVSQQSLHLQLHFSFSTTLNVYTNPQPDPPSISSCTWGWLLCNTILILLCYDMHTSSYRCRDCCDTVLMFIPILISFLLQPVTATSIIFSYFLFFVASDVSVSSLHHNTFFKKFFV